MNPKITKVECKEFRYPLEDVGNNVNGFNLQYEPGNVGGRTIMGIQIHTDTGITGEYVGGNAPAFAQIRGFGDYLIGKNPFNREKHWDVMKRALRKYDRMGMGPVDIALWDFAGKYYDAPIHELLGSYRTEIPAYASTYWADERGGLDSPEAFADFAEECQEMGYHGFKIHGWSDEKNDIEREKATAKAVGERVGDDFDLMYDPVCEYETFVDAIKVGRVLDEYDYLWFEDPYDDGGISQHAHRKLRETIDTPLLQTAHLRRLEPITDFVANEATDFVRADPEYDGGITAAMKIGNMAEGFGLDVEYHIVGPAQRHCIAATRNTNYYEMGLVHPELDVSHDLPVYKGDYSDAIDTVDDDGYVTVPDDPGLGVEYDWGYIDELAHQSVTIE